VNTRLILPSTVDVVLENLTVKDIDDILAGLNGNYTSTSGAARELRATLTRARLTVNR
jgi:hypothetical protein